MGKSEIQSLVPPKTEIFDTTGNIFEMFTLNPHHNYTVDDNIYCLTQTAKQSFVNLFFLMGKCLSLFFFSSLTEAGAKKNRSNVTG